MTRLDTLVNAEIASLSTFERLALLPQHKQKELMHQSLRTMTHEELIDLILLLNSKIDVNQSPNPVSTDTLQETSSPAPPISLPTPIQNQPPSSSPDTQKIVTTIGLRNPKKLKAAYQLRKEQIYDQLARIMTPYKTICTVPTCKLCFSWFMTSKVTPCSSKYSCSTACSTYGWFPHTTTKGLALLAKYHTQKRVVHGLMHASYLPDEQEELLSDTKWVKAISGIDGNRRRWISNICDVLSDAQDMVQSGQCNDCETEVLSDGESTRDTLHVMVGGEANGKRARVTLSADSHGKPVKRRTRSTAAAQEL
jgi:hypothetical protein